MRAIRRRSGFGAIALAAAACLPPAASPPGGSDRAAIERVLRRWPEDFSAKNQAAVCGLFAPNVVLSYPGGPDRGYEALCAQFGRLFATSDKTFRYAAPDIEEIAVERDVAVVRLIWTLSVVDAHGATLESVREKGVDVFARQPDGSWKIRISHAFPM